jgi:hypothetical protein
MGIFVLVVLIGAVLAYGLLAPHPIAWTGRQ